MDYSKGTGKFICYRNIIMDKLLMVILVKFFKKENILVVPDILDMGCIMQKCICVIFRMETLR